MEKHSYLDLFNEFAKTDSGKEQNLEEIERRLSHLRFGGSLSYSDLQKISDDELWPFNKYWMWPSKSQIEKYLKKTNGWFVDLPLNEERVIKGLNEIFKNLSLVSIILRFIWPEHYAIYSLPPLKLLRIERGGNAVEEYMNYLREMRLLRETFTVPRAADVDKIIWAIFYKKGKYLFEIKRDLALKLPENLTPDELVFYLSYDPLLVARAFLKQGEYRTAGFWAAKAFEKFLYDECSRLKIKTYDKPYERTELINSLCQTTKKWSDNWNLLNDARKLRNKIIPGIKEFISDDVHRLISVVERLQKISQNV